MTGSNNENPFIDIAEKVRTAFVSIVVIYDMLGLHKLQRLFLELSVVKIEAYLD
jgi:hypothetical protein